MEETIKCTEEDIRKEEEILEEMYSAETVRPKAIFVGISYANTEKVILGAIPYWYAKCMAQGLCITKDVFKAKECLIFADFKTNDIGEIKVKPPTKQKVIAALRYMITNAVEGDICLFYYCGHGNGFVDYDYNGHRGALFTFNQDSLNKKKKTVAMDVLYDTEFKEIISRVHPGVHLTMLIHCCFGGVMFVTPDEDPSSYTGPGIALTAVDASIPSSLTEPHDNILNMAARNDLTANIVKVIKDQEKTEWPHYQKLFTDLTAAFKGIKPDVDYDKLPSHCKQRLIDDPSLMVKPMMYFNRINPEVTRFLNGGQRQV